MVARPWESSKRASTARRNTTCTPPGRLSALQAQARFLLPSGQALPGGGLQYLQPRARRAPTWGARSGWLLEVHATLVAAIGAALGSDLSRADADACANY